MDIAIRVAGIPEGSDALIRRTTFNQVQKIKGSNPVNDRFVAEAGEPFGHNFNITLIDDNSIPENILSVTQAVKDRFYPNTNTMRI